MQALNIFVTIALSAIDGFKRVTLAALSALIEVMAKFNEVLTQIPSVARNIAIVVAIIAGNHYINDDSAAAKEPPSTKPIISSAK